MSTYRARILTGRCRTGSERGGTKAHAVAGDSDWATALCGAKPGRLSNGWSDFRPTEITCPKCIAKLAKLNTEARS